MTPTEIESTLCAWHKSANAALQIIETDMDDMKKAGVMTKELSHQLVMISEIIRKLLHAET